MTHEQIKERLSEWLDGELDGPASEAASRHIDLCASCKSEVQRLRRLSTALFMPVAPADSRSTEAFVARVMARVDEESVSSWERLAARFLVPAFGLALAGMLFAISLPSEDADAPLGVAAISADAASAFEVAP